MSAPVAWGFGNAKAPKGGTHYLNLHSEPPTLHPITSTDYYASQVQSYVLEGLMYRSPETYEWLPALITKYEVAPDGLSFTFWLKKGIKFHDGKPLTAEDVKFSFDMIFEPKYQAAHMQPYYEGIREAKIIDSHTIQFFARERYFRNFDSIAGMSILPKHIYQDPEASKKLNRTLVGTGAYKFDEWDKGKKIVLNRNKEWWGYETDELKNSSNFETLYFRFIKEDVQILERVNKGDIDYAEVSPENFVKQQVSAKIKKYKVQNKAPKSYSFIGWNLRNELFKDRNVRIALAHLMNREAMIKKFFYDLYVPATGPWAFDSDYADPQTKPISYDPKKANQLLSSAGWTDSDKDGVLDRELNGKKTKFEFVLIYANPDNEKYLTPYKEDLQKVGIRMELKNLEWNAFIKILDEGNFQAVQLGWAGGAIDVDPKQVWHSSSAVAGGSNFIGYENKEVDRLIIKARGELKKEARVKILREVFRKIADDAPYLFWFNPKFTLYLLNNRIGQERETYPYEVGTQFWWLKKD